MNPEIIGIPLAFVGLAALLCWLLIGSRGRWWLKAIVISGTLYVSLGLWYSASQLLGWPATTEMPARFEAHWLMIKEPAKRGGDPGAIYVWATDLEPDQTRRRLSSLHLPFHDKYGDNEPRLYKLPYSKKLHQQAEEIRDMLQNDGEFRGSFGEHGPPRQGLQDGPPEAKEGEQKQAAGRPGPESENQDAKPGEGGDLSQEQKEARFYMLPSSKLPPKDLPAQQKRRYPDF